VCKVYIAAYGRRILPHRFGGRARLACSEKCAMLGENRDISDLWTGNGPNMATPNKQSSLDTFYCEA